MLGSGAGLGSGAQCRVVRLCPPALLAGHCLVLVPLLLPPLCGCRAGLGMELCSCLGVPARRSLLRSSGCPGVPAPPA